MMYLPSTARRSVFSALLLILTLAPGATRASELAEVWHRDERVVVYRAFQHGGWLFVRAEHAEGWHTYAMDNVERARGRSGKDTPETELPTVITLDSTARSESLETVAPGWRQTRPLDLSQADIRWYTWGFSDVAWLALEIGADAVGKVVVRGQACTEDRCALIEDLDVRVEEPDDPTMLPDPGSLEPLLLGGDATAGDGGTSGSAGTDWTDAKGRRFDDLDLFARIFHRSIDLDCDGRVSIRDFVEIIGMSPDRPRQLNWMLAFDPDDDGQIEAPEVAAGLRTNIDYQVDRQMASDVDGDDVLTRREHALGVPDRVGLPEGEAYSELQRSLFAQHDRNGDERVERAEIEASYRFSNTSRYWGYALNLHLRRADANHDQMLVRTELETALGGPLDEVQAAWLERFAKSMIAAGPGTEKVPAISLVAFYGKLQASADEPVEWKLEIERPVRALLVPACLPADV